MSCASDSLPTAWPSSRGMEGGEGVNVPRANIHAPDM